MRGHRQLRRFVRNNQSLWAERHVRIETVASTCVGGRAVVELLAHLEDYEGQAVDWPIAVVAESPDELSVVFRTYCSQWPVDGQRHIRRPLLEPANTQLSDVVGRYLAALSAGDLDSIVSGSPQMGTSASQSVRTIYTMALLSCVRISPSASRKVAGSNSSTAP